ncbi:hypothetical protein [Streptomyces sp. AK02-01A]|uniref:hypothetical protein n=1 Tax=Streptomyces sp. AK02-01A TaxID=3028648 RepID=UPI0029B3110F|nr:hypothetical protein [Streptomyces sp. AK02-01A]MDX3850994.1 hypothetical protein [Streptomyces sp. AK02-01A]
MTTRDTHAALLAGTFDPGADANTLLEILGWCASAAGVAGLIIVGTQMALQLRRGEMGEGAGHMRSLFIVLGACVIAGTAGPIVSFLGPLTI